VLAEGQEPRTDRRRHLSQSLEHSEPLEDLDPHRLDPVRRRCVAGEVIAIDKADVETSTGEQHRQRGAGAARADDHDIESCANPRPSPAGPAGLRAERRARLLEVATNAVEAQGPEVLRARALTAEIGASTQAIYTLFGGMPGLFEAIVAEAFTRFARHVERVPETDDPVADFFAKGWAYTEWALAHPQLYRLMFGLTGGELRRHAGLEVAVAGAVANTPQAQMALDVLVGSMARITNSDRIDSADPVIPAGQFLSATHGWLLLEIGGAFGAEGGGLDIIRELAVNLMVGLGDGRALAEASFRAAEATKTGAG
jgi:AcrR family transcriptional regulator